MLAFASRGVDINGARTFLQVTPEDVSDLLGGVAGAKGGYRARRVSGEVVGFNRL
jgi:hypothetical protein